MKHPDLMLLAHRVMRRARAYRRRGAAEARRLDQLAAQRGGDKPAASPRCC